MKNIRSIILIAATLLVLCAPAQAQSTRWGGLAKLPFPGVYPTKEAVKILKDELAFQRGVQNYLWSLPARNMYAMREGQREKLGADSKRQILGPLFPTLFSYREFFRPELDPAGYRESQMMRARGTSLATLSEIGRVR